MAKNNPGLLFADIIFISIIELALRYAIAEGRKSGDRAPGDFGIKGSTKDLAIKEIRNGRIAM